MTTPPPIPVTLLTGFLGSGKTTLLNHWVKQPALARALVIINEFGEIGLDHHLVTQSADGAVIEMNSGCLCCTIRGDLTKTLRDITWRFARNGERQFDRVVIETTGLADPAPIIHTLMNDPKLAQQYRLEGVVTTIDAVNGQASLSAHPEALKQAAVADCLLLTKTDLADTATLSGLQQRLRDINPGARQERVAAGLLDPTIITRSGLYDPSSKRFEVERWLNAQAYPQVSQGEHPAREHAHEHARDHSNLSSHSHSHSHDHLEHDPNRHDDHIRAFCYLIDRPISAELLDAWLTVLREHRGADLLRVKGILNIDAQALPVVIHAVQHVVHPVAQLPAWPSPDRRSRIVFITRDIGREQIDRAFTALAASSIG